MQPTLTVMSSSSRGCILGSGPLRACAGRTPAPCSLLLTPTTCPCLVTATCQGAATAHPRVLAAGGRADGGAGDGSSGVRPGHARWGCCGGLCARGVGGSGRLGWGALLLELRKITVTQPLGRLWPDMVGIDLMVKKFPNINPCK